MKHISALKSIGPTIKSRLIKDGIVHGSQLYHIHPSVIMRIAQIGPKRTYKVYKEAAGIIYKSKDLKKIYRELKEKNAYADVYAEFLKQKPEPIKTEVVDEEEILDEELKKISIKVNPLSELLRIKRNRYQDAYDCIREFYQNALRAGATKVEVVVESDKLSFKDNGHGVGLEDLEKVFEIGTSGWDKDLISDQDAFGQGLFSGIILAKKLIIYSQNHAAIWDVEKALKTGKLEDAVSIQPLKRYIEGFQITLTNMEPEYSFSKAKKLVREYGKYMPYEVWVNGELLEKVGFEPPPGTIPMKISQNGRVVVEGWIKPAGFYLNRPEIFYYNVKYGEFDKLPYCEGKVNITSRYWLTRSEASRINYSGKETKRLQEYLTKKIQKYLIQVIKYGTVEEITELDRAIEHYLPIKVLIKYATFEVYDPETISKLIEFLKKKQPDSDPARLVEIMKHDEFVETLTQAAKEVEKEKREKKEEIVSTTKYGVSPRKLVRKKLVRKGVTADKVKGKTVIWLRKSEYEEYRELVDELKYYNYAVAIAINKVQVKVFENLNNFIHIRNLADAQKERKAKLYTVGAKNYRELRAMWLLSFIAKKLADKVGAEPPKVEIAYIGLIEQINVDGKKLKKKLEETEALAAGDRIIFERKYITPKLKLFERNRFPLNILAVGAGDIDFVNSVKRVFAHELAHYFYGTTDNTTTHYKLESKLQEDIDNIFISLPKVSKLRKLRPTAAGGKAHAGGLRKNDLKFIGDIDDVVSIYIPANKDKIKLNRKTKPVEVLD